MPIPTRSLAITIPATDTVSGTTVYTPNTGQTVKIVDAVDTGYEYFTLTETPVGSGQYVLDSFTPVAAFGYYKIGTTVMTEWGRIWLGVEAALRPVYLWRFVKVFATADSPTGAKGAPKTFTTGTSPLDAGSSEGSITPGPFSGVPIAAILNNYQSRRCNVIAAGSLDGSGNFVFQTAMSEEGEDYDATPGAEESYADIAVISID